jgi:hypothetical protein
MRGDLELPDPHLVPGTFVVEGEPAAFVADLAQAGLEADPADMASVDGRERPAFLVRGPHRVARQQVFQVGEDELLVLLLVVRAELGERG